MEQHPVPQQISAYEFRLVGDMTLKQFGQVAGGIIVALVIHATGLPGFIKWPLIGISILAGVAMAFFPIEERPLQTWIIAFFKAVYSPTQYVWHKKPYIPEILAEEERRPKAKEPEEEISPETQKRLSSYLESLPRIKSEIEAEEERFAERIRRLFSTLPPPPEFVSEFAEKPEEKKPQIAKEEPAGIRIRRLRGPLVMEVEGEKLKKQEELRRMTAAQVAPAYSPQYRPMPKAKRREASVREAEFGEIPMPRTPTIPNVVVGMITDKEGKMIEGAIIEIRDEKGNPVRAFKTNKLGQFQVVTPLPNGHYEIEVEKEGYAFNVYKFRLTGRIVEPIRIHAK